MRIKQSVKTKQELEKKLKYIQDNIGYLSAMELEKSSKSVREYSWLTEEERKKWQEGWMKKAQDAEEFTKKVAAIQKEIKQRQKDKDKNLQAKLAKDEEEKQRKEKEEAELKIKQKEEEKLKHVEELEEKKKERLAMAKLATDKPPKKTYLYQKMTQHYVDDVEMPELEKRKKEIADKRNVYKPIRMDDIEEFRKKHDEQMKKSDEERKKEQVHKVKEQAKYHEKVIKELKSGFTDEVIKKDNEKKAKVKEEEELHKEKNAKMKNYAKMVKESHLPVASEAKALELKKQIEQLKHQPRKPKEKDPNEKKQPRTPAETTKNPIKGVAKDGDSKPVCPKAKKKKQGESTKSIEGDKDKKKPVQGKIDYLSELAKNRGDSTRKSLLEQNFKKVINNAQLSPNDKYQLIKAQTEVLEQNARQKEALLSMKGDLNLNVNVGKEVSDMYINAIKAKLSLLEA